MTRAKKTRKHKSLIWKHFQTHIR